MNKKKIISVIIPYYKKRLYFKKTFNSVVLQKFKRFEVIIIYDDEDKTDLSYIKSIIKNKKNTKLIINAKNLGAGESRNKGIKISNGEYLAFLDSDDLWSKEKLSAQYNFMKKNKILISHTSYNIINSNDKIIGFRKAKKIQNYNDLISSCDIGLSSVMVKKEILKKNKFSNQTTKEDYSLWLNLSKKHNIPIKLGGTDVIPSFEFLNNHTKRKTFLTQEMLKNKILATNMIYITIFHNKNNIQKYIKILDKVFYDISKKNINSILKSDLCFKPINRIN